MALRLCVYVCACIHLPYMLRCSLQHCIFMERKTTLQAQLAASYNCVWSRGCGMSMSREVRWTEIPKITSGSVHGTIIRCIEKEKKKFMHECSRHDPVYHLGVREPRSRPSPLAHCATDSGDHAGSHPLTGATHWFCCLFAPLRSHGSNRSTFRFYESGVCFAESQCCPERREAVPVHSAHWRPVVQTLWPSAWHVAAHLVSTRLQKKMNFGVWPCRTSTFFSRNRHLLHRVDAQVD